MTTVRLRRPPSGVHADPLAGRFLGAYLVSLLLHGLLLFGLAGGWLRSAPREDKPPVYYVDLIHKPVLNPQAGRPEPRVAAPVSTPVAPVARVEPKTVLPSKSLPTERKSPVAAGHVSNALQKLRDEQALQQKFAALRQAQAVPIDTPVGLPDARGNESGVLTDVYVRTTLQQNWALSSYSLADPAKMAKLEAWVRITYGKSGRLESFRFEKESGDPQFDESIKRALVKSRQLPATLPVRLEDQRVIFNLRELAALAELRR